MILQSIVLALSYYIQYDHRSSKVDRNEGKSKNEVERSKHGQPDQSGKNKKNSPNLEGFNETAYVFAVKRDSDSYKRNAFNQEASDKLQSDRSLPDTRHYKLVWCTPTCCTVHIYMYSILDTLPVWCVNTWEWLSTVTQICPITITTDELCGILCLCTVAHRCLAPPLIMCTTLVMLGKASLATDT